jgi:two-component system, LuxR family, sensor kinase FixL
MPYEEYFKAATEGLIIVNGAGRIVEVNPAAERLFDYSEEELKGQPIELLLPEQLRELHRKHIVDYFGAPRTRAMGRGLSLAGRRKDGSEFPVEISLTYARGTSRGDLVVAAVVDISQRLALEQEVRRAETLTSLGTLAAGIAHDLNNPLQVIRSRSELLLESPDATPASDMTEDFAAIHRQAQRAGTIIEEFLELSRQRQKVLVPVDINELVDRTLLLIGEQLRTLGISIETRLDRSLPEVTGDVTALERVLVNLLTNARDAMPQGGTVTIASSLLTEDPNWLQLTVADDGPGMHSDSLGKVFNLLYTTKAGGSGLGLWLSRRIIQEHNGRIDVRSEPGKGAKFTIRLPAGDSSR